MRRFFGFSWKKAIIDMMLISILVTMGTITMTKVQVESFGQTPTVSEFTKVTASVDNVSPSQNTIVNVTVTGPAGSKVNLICHYKTNSASYSGQIGNDEKTIIPIQVGAATPGYAVIVDVSVISDETYKAQTMFIPH